MAWFQQLTTAPTMAHCLILADFVLDGLEEALDEYGDEDAADPSKWPLDRKLLAERIRKRLASADWYSDLTMGDAEIWYTVLRGLMEEPGQQIGIGFQCENEGFLYWDAAEIAARHGAPMMAEPMFGNRGFRNSGKSRGDVELIYTIYLPQQSRQLLNQLEKAVPHFEALPDEEDNERAQFFQGLLEPIRQIVAAGRVMWVQTDT